MPSDNEVHGSCLCGQVSLVVQKLNRDVVVCHCQQCRKQTGHVVAATRAKDNQLTVEGKEHIKWFAASADAKRGFCSHCGSVLFWKRDGTDHTSIMAGCLETPTGLKIAAHIFTAFKGDYYDIDDDVPQRGRSD